MAELSKLQIRAKVLSVISEIKAAQSYSEELRLKLVDDLKPIEDIDTLFDIFIKEFIKMSETEYMFASCVIKPVIDSKYVEDKVFEFLKSPAFSDDTKYKLVQLLRVLGANSAYDAIPQYFDNPQEVLDMETRKLLENAVFNPESMLDFLDFVYAVPKKDKQLLLESLKEDYQGDVLANIVYPILYADFDDEFKLSAIDILSESKSSLAIEPFNFLIKISKNEEIINACKLGLKKLKLSGASEEKAKEYFKNVVKDYKPAQFYATIPDGNGNQALLISRVNKEKQYCFEAVVINDTHGIIDSFGFFNISDSEITRIIEKFNNSEGKYKIPPEYAKTRINEALEASVKNNNPLPYEFVCWNMLMKDIKPLDKSVKQIVELFVVNEKFSKDEILELLTKDYTLRWFIKSDENKVLKDFIDLIYSQDDLSAEFISDNFNRLLPSVFDEETVLIWKNKLYNLIYLLLVNSLSRDGIIFNSMMNDEILFDVFKSVILQRSVFTNFLILRENQKESLLTVNIFRKKNTADSGYDSKKLDKILEFLKEKWINE